MADRTDIDALLIGALYGELTPADEARLTAHLESHPADRTALDDMARTRAAVRESRILAFQLEPPHAVSALLLQEASRRAPRSRDREATSWFQRFVRSFAAHPAMAAAATVVLVAGIAGSLYLHRVDQFAASEPPAATAPAVEPAPPTSNAAADPATPPANKPDNEPRAPQEIATAPAGSAGYRVNLDEAVDGKQAAPAIANDDDLAFQRKSVAAPPAHSASGGFQVGGKDRDLAKTTAKTKTEKQELAKLRGIEVRRPEPMPKELSSGDDYAQRERAQDKISANRGRRSDSEELRAPGATEGTTRGATTGAAAATTTPPPPPPAPAVAQGVAPAAPPPASAPARQPAKPAAKAPAPSNSNALADRSERNDRNDSKPADDKSARDAAWARKQRDQVVSLVTANNCDAAADAAMEIYNRAPSYFSSLLTDREVKPCLAYVRRQVDLAERSRAAKNVNAAEQAAPIRK
jgi:hypothetical protein